MTASAEAERQDRSKYRQCEGEGDGETSQSVSVSVSGSTSINNSSNKTFLNKLRRSLQYGTFKQVNHLAIFLICIINNGLMIRRRQFSKRDL